jgi:hypothetical protein
VTGVQTCALPICICKQSFDRIELYAGKHDNV